MLLLHFDVMGDLSVSVTSVDARAASPEQVLS
jgi:hypothetical protein